MLRFSGFRGIVLTVARVSTLGLKQQQTIPQDEERVFSEMLFLRPCAGLRLDRGDIDPSV